ncbi:hypothetical protein FOF52_14635 [Thermobifida alba]|uniref:Lipoprotein n=1 Tax=Thermobifida alba TaxID=53522 RepID=A0ABY4L319_THEAE|nr:hypothetical protein [Thermobifida alba]UPT22046.1 hypothetical protein FOF52_14635 [Thermobifida alba]
MKITRRSLRPPASALLALLLPLAACGVGDGDAEGGGAPSPEEQGVNAKTLSGFVRLAEDSVAKTVFLTFHNVDDGVQKLHLDLTELTARSETYVFFLEPADLAFTADFRRAAYETANGEIRVGELDPDARSYRVTATLVPEDEEAEDGTGEEASDGGVAYQTPQFSPDGSELWFEERREAEEEFRVLAVPSEAPLDAPPEERGRVPRDAWTLHEYEGHLLTRGPENVFLPTAAYTVTPDNELQVLTEPGGAADEDFHFLTDGTRVASKNFLSGPSGDFVGPFTVTDWGVTSTDRSTLHTFSLSPDGTVSDEDVLVEIPGKEIERVWADTDGSRYVLYVDGAYHGFPFHARGGAPTELFSEFTFDDSVAAQTGAAKILGIFPAQQG